MTLRQLLNVVHAHLMKGRDASQRKVLEEILGEKRWVEMTPDEQSKFERKIIAIQTGAYQAQTKLVGAMGMNQKRVRPT